MIKRKVLVECPHCCEDGEFMPAYTPSERVFPEPGEDAKAIDGETSDDASNVIACRECGNDMHQYNGVLEFDRAGSVVVKGESVTVIRGYKSLNAMIYAMSDFITVKMREQSGQTLINTTQERVNSSMAQMNAAMANSSGPAATPQRPRETAAILEDLRAGRITPDDAKRMFRDGDDAAELTSGAISRIQAIERGENPYDGLIIDGLSSCDAEEPCCETFNYNPDEKARR